MEREKVYFRLVVKEDWEYHFVNDAWDKLHFAWWKQQKKFIVESLIKLYWPKEWPDIMNKFLQWLDYIQNISPYWKGTWVFVLYPRIDVTQK